VSVADFFEMRMVTGAPGTGRALQDYVNRHVGMRPIERFRVPFAAVATRIRDGKLAIFNHGDAGAAVRASSASPGQFEPVGILGERYVDGDEASPVPIAAARALGARIVIAVDVSAYLSSTPAGVPAEWVAKDERRARQIAGESGAADVLVHPDLGYYAGHSEEYRRRIIALAEEATRARIPEIRAAMARAASQASTVASSPSAEAAR
jgi:NTE family protein